MSPEAQAAGWVAAARGGDEHAWADLVARFEAMIATIARAHRLSDEDADDVAQSTWCTLLHHMEGLHRPERVGAWLATTARRECLRVLRRSRATVPFGDELPEVASDDPTPEAWLARRERDDALWRGFQRLGDRDQRLLGLLIAEDAASYEEIAAALTMPVGSIGPTRARALQRLRRELEPELVAD